jgi:hypothetical protein
MKHALDAGGGIRDSIALETAAQQEAQLGIVLDDQNVARGASTITTPVCSGRERAANGSRHTPLQFITNLRSAQDIDLVGCSGSAIPDA